MFGLSGAEIAIIGIVIVLIFGVGRITKIGSELGGGLKNFRDALKDDDSKSELEEKKEKLAETERKLQEDIMKKDA